MAHCLRDVKKGAAMQRQSLFVCPACGQSKSFREFCRDSSNHFAPTICVECMRREVERRGMMVCRRCQEAKPLSGFHKDTRRVTGYTDECRDCRRVIARAAHILRTYGITQDQYDALYAEQEGRCAICGCDDEMMTIPNGSRNRQARRFSHLYVDHDHRTGKVRGLLCQDCNLGLGAFKDNGIILRTAAAYLRKHQRGVSEAS